MLASCESKWGHERQYGIFGKKKGTTTSGTEESQMGRVVWNRGETQKVLEKSGMKKKSIKSKLTSAERGVVKVCGMNLRSTERGRGLGSATCN